MGGAYFVGIRKSTSQIAANNLGEKKMSLTGSQIDKVYDISGKICPYTVLETREALKLMAPGQVLEVLSDYKPAATESIPNFCTKKNYPFEVIKNGDGSYRILIKKEE